MKQLQRHILLFGAFLMAAVAISAQPAGQRPSPRLAPTSPTVQDTLKKNKVDVDHADVFEYIQRKDTVFQKLNGNVELRQDSVYMYCDTAVIKNNTHVTANGKVIIQQGDSTSVFADSAMYDGILRIAELYGDVVLVNGEQKLFTDRLTYDLTQKLATYSNGATLTLDSTQLTSKRGYYYVQERQIYFKDSVIVVNPEFHLRSDTLGFNTETEVVSFLGPTLISSDSTRIYTEDGYYDTKNNLAAFTRNAQFQKGEQEATADTIRYDGGRSLYSLEGNARFEEGERRATADFIRYDEANDKTFLSGNARYQDEKQDIVADEITYDAKKETYSTRGRSVISDPPQILLADQVDYNEEKGLGIALGNVIWRDTSAELTIVCEAAEYDRKTDYLKASGGRDGRPLLITTIEGDSLFMVSDTLLAIREDSVASDSARQLIAYYDVRIYKSDMQAVCDSLSYKSSDSTFYFFPLRQNPIVWSDTSQFTADTVMMLLADDKIDKIFMRNNGFIVNSPDELFFNQVKGKNVTAFFEENELRRMAVVGNAESVYYARDEGGGYVGVNKTVCSEMLLYFGDNQVDQIKFFTEPRAEMKPMKQADHEALRMAGFFWEKIRRPMSLADLFDPGKAPPSPASAGRGRPAEEQAPPVEGASDPAAIPVSTEPAGETEKE
ncbi:MAG: hypothetical protein H6556_07810 [Lewinellaceae bacterium]|nr:hypothetical protein [Lewinellaceae bacterium]